MMDILICLAVAFGFPVFMSAMFLFTLITLDWLFNPGVTFANTAREYFAQMREGNRWQR